MCILTRFFLLFLVTFPSSFAHFGLQNDEEGEVKPLPWERDMYGMPLQWSNFPSKATSNHNTEQMTVHRQQHSNFGSEHRIPQTQQLRTWNPYQAGDDFYNSMNELPRVADPKIERIGGIGVGPQSEIFQYILEDMNSPWHPMNNPLIPAKDMKQWLMGYLSALRSMAQAREQQRPQETSDTHDHEQLHHVTEAHFQTEHQEHREDAVTQQVATASTGATARSTTTVKRTNKTPPPPPPHHG